MSIQKINGDENFVKDNNTNAILAVDQRGLKAYKAQRKQKQQIIDDINNIKSELSELKILIRQLISG